jgi:hypothetical protein
VVVLVFSVMMAVFGAKESQVARRATVWPHGNQRQHLSLNEPQALGFVNL